MEFKGFEYLWMKYLLKFLIQMLFLTFQTPATYPIIEFGKILWFLTQPLKTFLFAKTIVESISCGIQPEEKQSFSIWPDQGT